MVLRPRKHRLLNSLIALFLMFQSAEGFSVVSSSETDPVQAEKDLPLISSHIAQRAYSDLQVRKLLNLFAEKKLSTDALYERLKELKFGR